MSRIIIAFISFIAALWLGFGVVTPKYQNLQKDQVKLQETKTKLQYKEEQIANLTEISNELKQYEQELAKINSAIPTDPVMPYFYDFLQKAVQENGLILDKVGLYSTTAVQGNPRLKQIKIGINISGSYPAFNNFLSVIEKSARLIEIESVSFAYPAKKTSPQKAQKIEKETEETTQEGAVYSFGITIKTQSY